MTTFEGWSGPEEAGGQEAKKEGPATFVLPVPCRLRSLTRVGQLSYGLQLIPRGHSLEGLLGG